MRNLNTDLIPCPLAGDGFFISKTCDYISVNKNGDVFNRLRLYYRYNTPSSTIEDSRYVYFIIFSQRFKIHDIVVETFLSKSHCDDNKKLMVNHIDGIKDNNCLDNLEWVSYSGNMIHALETGLRTDNMPILVKDLRDGKITRYYGYSVFAESLGLNRSAMWTFMNSSVKNKIFADYYSVIKEGEEWYDINPSTAVQYSCKYSNEYYVIDTIKNISYTFESLSYFSEITGIDPRTISSNLKKRSDNKEPAVTREFKYWFLSDLPSIDRTKINKVIKPRSDYRVVHKERPILVTNLRTGVVKEYPGFKELCEEWGVSKNTLQKYLSLNNRVWKNSFKVVYKHNESSSPAIE